MNRTSFVIDGFNLYHSVAQASHDLGNASTKWLNILSLCNSYLYLVGNKAHVENIFYFSALADHLSTKDPDKVNRHKIYIEALTSTGIKVQLGRFKAKEVWCSNCKTNSVKYEEKETDVAIAAKIFEILIKNESDSVVIVSGDTDIAPVIRTANTLFPKINIIFAFPYKRVNKELKKLASNSFNIAKEHYTKHQFPNSFSYNGKTITKPASW